MTKSNFNISAANLIVTVIVLVAAIVGFAWANKAGVASNYTKNVDQDSAIVLLEAADVQFKTNDSAMIAMIRSGDSTILDGINKLNSKMDSVIQESR